MNRDPELTPSGPEDAQSEYQEAMKDVEPFNQETAEKERKLEKMREQLIKNYALGAIGGPEELRKWANNHESKGSIAAVQTFSEDLQDLAKSVVGRKTIPQHWFNGSAKQRTTAIIRAGMASMAGSEDGLKTAATVDVKFGGDDGKTLDDRQMRFFQIGKKEVSKNLGAAIQESLERMRH